MTLPTCELKELLLDLDLFEEITDSFYGRPNDEGQFRLKKMLPNRFLNTPHDKFHGMACRDTHWQLEYCYHSVGECMELRDAAQTFRVVFRLKQEFEVTHTITGSGVKCHEEWGRYFVIDRIDGREALGRYLMTWKLSL